jgi:hypothetical protein
MIFATTQIRGVELGVIRRWRHVIAVAVAAVVEQDDAVLAKLARAEPPNPAMAAVPVLRLGCGRILVAAGLRMAPGFASVCRPALLRSLRLIVCGSFWQSWGQGFESPQLHHFFSIVAAAIVRGLEVACHGR